MLKELYRKGIQSKACGACQARCGLNKNQPYFDNGIKSTMNALAEWVIESDKILVFLNRQFGIFRQIVDRDKVPSIRREKGVTGSQNWITLSLFKHSLMLAAYNIGIFNIS
ncbi:hypothetical protein [Hydrogenimonas sp.]